MAAGKPIWGIDVGQCSLKAIKVQADGEQIEMLAVDVVEHDSILSQAESDAPEIIKKAIETFLSRNDVKESHVVVSVPGQQTLTRFTKMPPVEKKKIPDMVQYEAGQQIPFDMDEVVWDYQVFTEEDSPDVEVGIFAIRKELIRNHLTHFMDRGLEPIMVQTSPMASYNAAKFEWSPAEGEATILLDMGALATDLIIFEGNRIWSRPVPIGGNRFTEALVSAFKISFSKAERLKRSASSSKYARQVFQAMRPVFADLVSEVQRSIGFYTSTHREARITRILAMGNAFKLPGLQKFLQQNLQIDVEKVSGFKKLKVLSGEKASDYADNVMSFGVAYGLALQGLGLAAVEANLLPLEVQRMLSWRKKRPWFAASAACLALAAGSLWVGNVMANGQLAEGLGKLDAPVPPRVNTIEQAEQIVRSGPAAAPVERAAKLVAAAQKLQDELRKVSAQGGGNDQIMKDMAKLPENNVMIPRIFDVIHRAFSEASREDVREIKTGPEYLALVERVPRMRRQEFWIEGLRMFYTPKNAWSRFFPGSPQAKKKGRRMAGWAIRLVGTTSEPEPAKLIDEKLIEALTRLGREPNRGMHFAKVTLDKVVAGRINLDQALEDEPSRGRGTRGGRRSVITPGRTDSPRGPGGIGSRTPGQIGRSRDGRTMTGGGRNQTGSFTLIDAILKYRKQFRTHDPLTNEETGTDQGFTIHIVVQKTDTPDELIPEVYKEKKDAEPEPSETDR